MFWLRKELGIRRSYGLARKGKTAQALDQLNRLLSQSPQDVDLSIQKAWCLADLKEYDLALQWTDEILKMHPKHSVLHLIRGEVLYALKQYVEAKDALLQSLNLAGENIRVEYSLGLVYVALGDMEKASQYFESSVKYDRTLVQSRLLAMAEAFLLRERERKSEVL